MSASHEMLGLASEVVDAVAVAVPRGWTGVELKLEVRGGQVHVLAVDAKLGASPPPKPELGMDASARLGGLGAALEDLRRLLLAQRTPWDGGRAKLSRPTPRQIILTLLNGDGRPVRAVMLPSELVDALFVSEPFLAELQDAQGRMAQAARRTAERLAGMVRWSYSQPLQMACFEFEGRPGLEVPAQVLGTYLPDEQSWLWGWANKAVEPGCTQRIEQALAPDLRQPGLAVFWREKFPCEEEFAHQVAQLAAVRAQAAGVFRGRAGQAHLYLALMG
jgi:hypothetical protein